MHQDRTREEIKATSSLILVQSMKRSLCSTWHCLQPTLPATSIHTTIIHNSTPTTSKFPILRPQDDQPPDWQPSIIIDMGATAGVIKEEVWSNIPSLDQLTAEAAEEEDQEEDV